jgi:hypothetical protein
MAIAVLYIVFGVTDVIIGPEADPGIPEGLTGLTPTQLNAGSPPAYLLFDFFTRVNGWSLVMIGWLTAAVLWFGFRRNERWAWWAMWFMPVWIAGIGAFYVVVGVEPTQAPPQPMISAPILAVFSAAVLLVSAPRFFRARSGPLTGAYRADELAELREKRD